jgi:hypothetical protein
LKREGQQHSGREAANLSGTPETGEVADLSSNRRGGGRPEHALGEEILAADRRWLACLARTRQGMLVAGNGDPSPCAPLLLTVVLWSGPKPNNSGPYFAVSVSLDY